MGERDKDKLGLALTCDERVAPRLALASLLGNSTSLTPSFVSCVCCAVFQAVLNGKNVRQ